MTATAKGGNPQTALPGRPARVWIITVGALLSLDGLIGSTSAAAQHTVAVIEFTLTSPNPSDRGLKESLMRHIRDEIGRSAQVDKATYVTESTWEFVHDEEAFFESLNVRFIVHGSLEDLSDNRMRVEVSLHDRQGTLSDTTFTDKLRKTLGNMDPWFEQVAEEVVARIEGRKLSARIFTDCFRPVGSVTERLELWRRTLPLRLLAYLEDSLPDYELFTFEADEMQAECAGPTSQGRDLAHYEYVISGLLSAGASAQTLVVVAWVRIKGIRTAAWLDDFEGEDGNQFAEQLAAHIISEWRTKVRH